MWSQILLKQLSVNTQNAIRFPTLDGSLDYLLDRQPILSACFDLIPRNAFGDLLQKAANSPFKRLGESGHSAHDAVPQNRQLLGSAGVERQLLIKVVEH